MILLSQISILTGGMYYNSWIVYSSKHGSQSKPLVIVHFILFFLLMTVIEGIYQQFLKKETQFSEVSNTISREDFKKRVAGGEQLVIMDDMVLDVSKFKLSHPGGKFVIEYNIGRDVSKFFYGGYILENGTGLKPHTHSNIARCIVNSLAIARLEEKAKTFTCRIAAQHEINNTTTCFTLRAEGPEQKFRLPASNDIGAIGRHFLIRSMSQPTAKRHYTVCTCMKPDIYQEYQNAVRAFQRGENVVFNEAVLQEKNYSKECEIICTVKNYKNPGGVSHRLHTAYNDLYQVKALLGKGLGIQKEGHHVAFVAGTGILVFIDLVAFMIRLNLGLLSQSDC